MCFARFIWHDKFFLFDFEFSQVIVVHFFPPCPPPFRNTVWSFGVCGSFLIVCSARTTLMSTHGLNNIFKIPRWCWLQGLAESMSLRDFLPRKISMLKLVEKEVMTRCVHDERRRTVQCRITYYYSKGEFSSPAHIVFGDFSMNLCGHNRTKNENSKDDSNLKLDHLKRTFSGERPKHHTSVSQILNWMFTVLRSPNTDITSCWYCWITLNWVVCVHDGLNMFIVNTTHRRWQSSLLEMLRSFSLASGWLLSFGQLCDLRMNISLPPIESTMANRGSTISKVSYHANAFCWESKIPTL